MPRRKLLSDNDVLTLVRTLLVEEGEKAVSFSTVGKACGLAPSTLVQRFGTLQAMRRAAIAAGWQDLSARTAEALAAAADKGPQGLLKALDAVSRPVIGLLRTTADADGRALADTWRQTVETALMARIGQGEKAREAAAILFAAWQGQMLWAAEGFRLKDAVKRLT